MCGYFNMEGEEISFNSSAPDPPLPLPLSSSDNTSLPPSSSSISSLSSYLSSLITTVELSFYTFLDSVTDAALQFLTSLLHSFLTLLYPLLKILFYLLFSFLLANIVYYFLYKLFFPIDLIDEELHVIYPSTPPSLSSSTFPSSLSSSPLSPSPYARIKLTAPENQWRYLHPPSLSQDDKICQRFLHSNSEYQIKLKFFLSKSVNNQNIKKCMIDLNLIDCSGDVIGHSARVLRVPYTSVTLSWIKFMLQLPWLVLGFVDETDVIEVEMMNNYRERSRNTVPTDVIEVVFSSEAHQLDIEKVTLTILPLPTGIAYYMYFFPYASFIGGVLFLFYYFLALLLLLRLAQSAGAKRLFGFLFSDDTNDDDESPLIGESPINLRPANGMSPTSPSPLLLRARELRQAVQANASTSITSEPRELASSIGTLEHENEEFIPYRRRMFGPESDEEDISPAESKSMHQNDTETEIKDLNLSSLRERKKMK